MLFKRRSAEKKPPEAKRRSWRVWREPLIHFFVLGLAVFGLHAALDRNSEAIGDDPFLVEISSAHVEWMHTLFNKQMGRAPTARDLRGQVNQLIREQILSREAVAMGLDKDDIVVRRRLAQKMEFLFKDLSAITEPTEEDLRSYYFENRRKYETQPQVTFTHVFFNAANRGIEGAEQAAQSFINEGVDPSKATMRGDLSILETGCAQCSVREIRDRFGMDFADALEDLSPGSWYGPVKSAYGIHAVYVHDRLEATLPDFNDIIDQVSADLMFANQEANTHKVYGKIRLKYRVLVEGLPYDLDINS